MAPYQGATLTKEYMLIDTHCHLNFQAFEKDLEEVITRAKSEGVEKIIIPGAKIDSSQKAIEIAGKYDNCYAAIGVHPHHESDTGILGYYDIKKKLVELAKNKKVVAIGEFGLDYYEYQQTVHQENKITAEIKQKQKELLKIHLEVARECNLPIILHCREAFEDMLPIVLQYLRPPSRSPFGHLEGVSRSVLRGVFHCFGGNEKDLKRVLDMGFYIGFDGNITFKNAYSLQNLVKLTPLDRILTETDAPYLSPEPFRGKRNEPKNVKIIARKIAEIKGIRLEEIEKITTKNALKLFFNNTFSF
ncbi:MAG: TatD family hydrolase [Patescibacteria group bacterium]|nr:TatD family hydrolase [Patescibacteria group bacterium]